MQKLPMETSRKPSAIQTIRDWTIHSGTVLLNVMTVVDVPIYRIHYYNIPSYEASLCDPVCPVYIADIFKFARDSYAKLTKLPWCESCVKPPINNWLILVAKPQGM